MKVYFKDEIWKSVNGYAGSYEISNYGRVKSLSRCIKTKNNKQYMRKEIILKQYLNKSGYYFVNLCKSSKMKNHRIHRLVAKHFISNKSKYNCVNHKDGNKINNHVENLEWCTFSYNLKHAHEIGIKKAKSGVDNYFSKLDNYDVTLIKILLNNTNLKQKDIASMFNIHTTTISKIYNNVNWKHIQ